MLAPISAEQALLLERMSTAEVEVLSLLVRRANGLQNPVYANGGRGEGFDRFVALYASLREQGVLDVVRTDGGANEILIHDCSPTQAAQANELLRLVGIETPVAPIAPPPVNPGPVTIALTGTGATARTSAAILSAGSLGANTQSAPAAANATQRSSATRSRSRSPRRSTSASAPRRACGGPRSR